MRKTLSVRKITLAILSLLLGCVTFLIGFIQKDTRKALAEETATESVNVEDYFSVNSDVTVTKSVQVGATVSDCGFQYGVVLSSDKAYSGSIVPTFKGDASIAFKFPHPTATTFSTGTKTGGDGNGDFKFIVTDVVDPSNYIVVHYMQGQSVRIEYPTENGMKYLTSVVSNPGFNNNSFLCNILDLSWGGANGDELTVCITKDSWAPVAVLAAFTGATEDLPKMSFPNGYKISFASDYAEGTDVAFKYILGSSTKGDIGSDKFKYHTEMVLSDETVAVPAEATEVITYNGIELVDDGVMGIPQYKQLGSFSTAWKYGDMLFPKETLTATGTIDTTTLGNEATVTVEKDGTHTYTFRVIEPVAPALNLVGEKPTDEFVKRAVTIPTPISDLGVQVETKVMVKETELPLDGYTFMPTQAGTHTVTYTAKAYGYTVTESFNIQVIADEVKPVVSVDYKDNYVAIGSAVTLPAATATDNADGDKTVQLSVTKNGEPVTVNNNKFTADELGAYIVTYACEDISGNKTEIVYTVTSINPAEFISVPANRLVTVQGASVSAQVSSNKYVGLGISSTSAYTGSFNAIFEGDNTLSFKFPGAQGTRGTGAGDFFFKIADANDPSDYFTVRYGGGGETMSTYVEYKGENRYSDANGRDPSAAVPKSGTTGTTYTYAVGIGSDSSDNYNRLKLNWENGVLSVIVNLERWAPAIERPVAVFDGTDEVSATGWGLPKLDWSAYTVSFGSNYAENNEDQGTDIVFLGVDDETDYFAEAQIQAPILDTFLYDGKIVQAGDTLFAIKKDGAGEMYSRFGANGVVFQAKKLLPNETIPTEYGIYDISYTVADKTYNFKMRVADEFNFPVVKLKNEISSMTVVKINSAVSVSAADVEATDDSCGVMQASQISIFVKKPTETDFVAYTNACAFDTLGEYVIKYVAADASDNQSSIERVVKVIQDVAPTVSISEELPKFSYLGQTLTLPTATATGATVRVLVSYAGEMVEVQNNQLVLNKEGEYTVVYMATTPNGAVGVLDATVTVIKDEDAPVISVDFKNQNVVKGTSITLPVATASDNVDDTATVSVRVQYGKEAVTVTAGKFTADKLGAYTVTYYSRDIAGNVGESSFIVNVQEKVVLPETPDDGEQPPAPDSSSDVSSNDSVDSSTNGNANDASSSNEDNAAPVSGGCFGSVGQIASSIMLAVVATAALFAARKRKSKE